MDSKIKSKIKLNKNMKKNIITLLTGAVSGFINGLFGGGGGMIVVPMLTDFLDCPVRKAHATAMLIILPLSITSGLLYASSGNFHLDIGIPVSIGVISGGIIGAFALSKLSSKWVVIIFSVIMALAGMKMLFL